jgi:hypothetical protein
MITITSYYITPATQTVAVEYAYVIADDVQGVSVPRTGNEQLSETNAPLDKPDWTDDDLCAALATRLGRPASDVTMAQPE